MAYARILSTNHKAATLVAVAALHGAALYAIVSGFAATVWEKVDVYMPTRFYPAEPPPPPEPVAEPQKPPIETSVVVPPQPLPLPPKGPELTVLEIDKVLPKALPSHGPDEVFIPPQPVQAAVLFRPRAAAPIGSPGRWATTEDYPAAELRREIEGTARFRVTVGADGRVSGCEIVVSSGSPGLDRATCENVSRRARFKPATDESGAAVTGSYSSSVRWEIPG